MISERALCWCKLSDVAVQELLLLLSLYDQLGSGIAGQVLTNIREKRYYRRSVSQLAFALEHRMQPEGYVAKDDKVYVMTRIGRARLRDLCELANAMPSRAGELSVDGFKRVRELRHNLKIYPFTNGRCVADGQQIRKTSGYSVYAILLHESSFGIRYKVLNRNHDPCLPCVYVGMTRQTPLERFDQHRFGKRRLRSKYVDPTGLCLMPLLYSPLNTQRMSKYQALDKEKRFANSLRERGFAVFAGHLDRPRRKRKRSYSKSKYSVDRD